MKKRIVRILSLMTLVFALNFVSTDIQAQCPMCKMSAEKNLDGGGTAGKGLNAGVLYMLMTPYILVGTIGYIWWRNKRKEEEVEFE